MNDSLNDSGAIHGTVHGIAPERRTERLRSDPPASRAPADQGIKGAGIRGLRTNSPSVEGGASSTREESPNNPAEPKDDRWLCALRRTGTTVTLLNYTPEPVAAVLRSKPWARLVRGLGWSFPADYLEHVERLLDGASVDLFDVDGHLTPAQLRRRRQQEHAETERIVGDLRAARDASEADTRATEQARRAARKAFADALAARKGEPA